MNIDFDYLIIFAFSLIFLNLGVNFYWLVRKRNISLKKRLVSTTLVLGIAIIIPFAHYLTNQPKISKSTPSTEGIWSDYSKPIEIVFNIPIDTTRIMENINPQIPGKWIWQPYLGLKRISRVGLFYPDETLFEGQRIVLYLTGIGRYGIQSESHEGGIVFGSVKPPEIQDILPENNSTDIPEAQTIKITFDKPLSNTVDITYKLTPNDEFNIIKINDLDYKIEPKNSWQLNTEYKLEVFEGEKRINLKAGTELERNNPVLIHQYNFNTQNEPLISRFSPEGSDVRPDNKIKILFNADMNRSSVENNLKITPNLEGTFSWLSDKAMVFIPKSPLQKDTQYKIFIAKNALSKNNLHLEKDLTYQFTTIGKVRVNEFVPFNNEVKVNEKTQIKVTFNQEVDHESAQNKFSLTPSTSGDFSWSENTLTFIPRNNLAFNTLYTIKIASGVKSIYGIDNTEEISSSFTTRRNEVLISMPLYYQPQYPVSFSCNIYASMMALAWKGFNTTASGLISEIGNDSSQDSEGKWLANPNEVYVGNGDGSWGYGAYWYAIQKVFTNRGIKTEVHENWNLSSLAQSVANGHPVEIWRYNGTSSDYNLEWGTPGVYAINGQHGGVITGFRGSVDNPTAFYINDPWFGLIWMDSNTFDYYWSRLNRVGLVIF